jgi:uncharacterized protein (TIGR00730 family)
VTQQPLPPIQRVCVFCGSQPGADPRFREDAIALGALLASHRIALVYGGASIGLMGALADAVLNHGGEAFGVIPDTLLTREINHLALTRLHVVPTMHDRKAMMYDLSDAFIALPGGMGTLDELFEVLTWAQLGLHHKPCALLNTAHYFDGLISFLHHASAQQLIRPAHLAHLAVASTPAQALAALLSPSPLLPPKLPREAI